MPTVPWLGNPSFFHSFPQNSFSITVEVSCRNELHSSSLSERRFGVEALAGFGRKSPRAHRLKPRFRPVRVLSDKLLGLLVRASFSASHRKNTKGPERITGLYSLSVPNCTPKQHTHINEHARLFKRGGHSVLQRLGVWFLPVRLSVLLHSGRVARPRAPGCA